MSAKSSSLAPHWTTYPGHDRPTRQRTVLSEVAVRIGWDDAPGPVSVAVAFHGLAEGEAEVAAGGVEVGMDRERAAEERGGLAVLAEGHVAEPLA
jgi:hypothetical protein